MNCRCTLFNVEFGEWRAVLVKAHDIPLYLSVYLRNINKLKTIYNDSVLNGHNNMSNDVNIWKLVK